MERKFDLIVIGTGAAGSAAAYKCRKAGWDVAIIDSRPFGGTCALRGCDPKKVLVGAAELIDWTRRMEGKGVSARGSASRLGSRRSMVAPASSIERLFELVMIR